MRFRNAAAAVVLVAGLALAGCSGTTRYEDCEVDDQYHNGDLTLQLERFESDCGYWEKDGRYFLRNEQVVPGGRWHWWSWVTPGLDSYPPEEWKPPHGLEPPKESRDARRRRENREEKKPAVVTTGSKKTTKAPAGSGNQGIPKRDPAQPAAPRPPKPRG